MGFEDFLYTVGERGEAFARSISRAVVDIINPHPAERPPSFTILRRFVKRELTPHEFLSLRLQIAFLAYLVASFICVVFRCGIIPLSGLFLLLLLYFRWIFKKYGDYFVDLEPYRFFYYVLSTISFGAFLGYLIFRRVATELYHYYLYIFAVFVVVLAFRWYFKERYGRDYTYGVVEEIKNDLARVFVHDDIAANVKPGFYWVEAVDDLRVGSIVKLLVEERRFRSSVPVRILEVFLEETQSSQTSTEPKAEAE